MERSKIFISYSRRDRKWKEEIAQFLTPLIRERIEEWDDSRISPGANWFDEIQRGMDSAKVAVLLVSQSFLASDFITKHELPRLLEAGLRGQLTVIWVPVSASSFRHTALADLQAVVDPNKPLDTLPSARRNQALVAISEAIVQAMDLQPKAEGVERVVLLYKRWSDTDEEAVHLLDGEFKKHGVQVFIDRHLPAGVPWGKRLAEEIRKADAVIPMLSSASITSEMMAREVAIASDAAQEQDGQPRLLPVRLAFRGKLPPSLELLNSIQHVEWESPEDNARVVDQLMEGMRNKAKQPFARVDGVMPSDDEFYVARKTDTDLEAAIRGRASIITIKGARQMGCSALLARGLRQAQEAGEKVVYTDFQRFNLTQLETLNDMYRALAESIDDSLELGTEFDQVWRVDKAPNWNFERYFKRHLLSRFPQRLVWGMDEVDRLFKYPYAGEFFGLLRAWHNDRRVKFDTPLERLTMVIAYATEPYLFIQDANQSPFNVGISLRMQDFDIDQVGQLAYQYGVLLARADLERFYNLVGGHPYLVRRGLAELQNRSLEYLLGVASREDGPFGDHLRSVLMTLAARADLLKAVSTVLRGHPDLTPEQFIRLRKAGILAGDSHQDATMRCPLYREYLRRHLVSEPRAALTEA